MVFDRANEINNLLAEILLKLWNSLKHITKAPM
jgi:hypothetical protein